MTLLARKMVAFVSLTVVALLLLTPIAVHAADFDHDHGAWNLLLKDTVRWNNANTASEVDYERLKENHAFLTMYLERLSAVSREEFDRWGRAQRLAFLINAYNAFTVELILTEYPALDSIKDLGSFFSSPWKKKFFRLLGVAQSLDGIEHDLIRGSGRYNEPLIHFAVNCASVGCPALLNEAYVADKLDRQLLSSTQSFLRDRSRNRFDRHSGTLEVSSIFDWYAEDFEQGFRGYDSLEDFFRTHANWLTDDLDAAERLQGEPLNVDFLDYDWALNEFKKR